MLPHLAQRHPLGCWVQGLIARALKNVVVVALANKPARVARAVLAILAMPARHGILPTASAR